MKILQIGGKNLASLEEEFLIDFNDEPLKSAGIFAISGNTGSGKSTILDALCLALYDKTPRTNQAVENIPIEDIPGQSVNQGDPRSVLRRGCAEGYATVTFVALNREVYRSEWRVRRARGRADGALQSTAMVLTNLTQNREEQGTKTELLERVRELTGLTFDQFTRSVLLAQGDFATFLKAKQSEKADLLEKLTGTEIYSRISIEIYNRAKEAEGQKRSIQEKIGSILLLTPQEELSLLNEHKSKTTELDATATSIKETENIQRWSKQRDELEKSVEVSRKTFEDLTKEQTVAGPRNLFLQRYEQLQQIRDPYNLMTLSAREHAGKEKSLEDLTRQTEEKRIALANCEARVRESRDKLLALSKEHSLWEPVIETAIQTASVTAQKELLYNQLNKEHQLLSATLMGINREIKEKGKLLKAEEAKTEYCNKWFERYQPFTTAYLDKKNLQKSIDNLMVLQKGAAGSRQIIDRCNITLKNKTERKAELQKTIGELDKILPAEIAKLRASLSPDTPCPVCGSTTHPYTGQVTAVTLREEELNKRKNIAKTELEEIEKSLVTTMEEITRATQSAQIYDSQLKDSEDSVETILKGTGLDWKPLVAGGALAQKLDKLFGYWDKYSHDLQEATEKEKTIRNTLLILNEKAKEQGGIIERGTKEIENLKREIEALREKSSSLLGGKSVKEFREEQSAARKQMEKELEQLGAEYAEFSKEHSSLTATCKAVREETKRLAGQAALALSQIREWISKTGNQYTMDEIAEILSKEHSFIESEKSYILDLSQRVTMAKATLIEREGQLTHHIGLNPAPGQREEPMSLQRTLDSLLESRDTLQKYITAIEVKLKTNEIETKKSTQLRKELEEKTLVAEEWNRLNSLFGSANGGKFKEIAQSYTLDILLSHANIHLTELTSRYKLERTGSSLGLQVSDLDMLGEIRSVHSLSGGESFLISLALALGLASLSTNRMSVESLFIDEGFGSLDIETLRIAIDALERLRSSGRKIGVISHVSEMTERIGVQVKVVKTSNGKSRIEILSGS
jgi:exonuclease SbcC